MMVWPAQANLVETIIISSMVWRSELKDVAAVRTYQIGGEE